MRLADVVNQLKLILPKYSDLFATDIAYSSIIALSNVATVIAQSAHGLETADLVTLYGFESETSLSSVSQDGLIFTFETSTDHDLTENWQEEVLFSGFTDSSWNDSFTLISVPNRRTFKVQSTNAIPTLNGNEVIFENRTDGINGQYSVTKLSNTVFSITGTFNDGEYQNGTVNSSVRIAGAVTFDRAREQYTENKQSDAWLFVVMADPETSKDRTTLSDAVATPVTGSAIRLRLLDGFSLFMIINTSEDIAAQDAIDTTRHDLLLPILKSVYGARFTTGLSGATDFRTVFTGHGAAYYDRAIYVHEYDFQLSMDLTELDTVEPSDTRAFRDIQYTDSIGDADTTDMSVTVDLDDQVLDK